MFNKRRQNGMSLIELMLSMALSCLLMSVLFQLFSSSKYQYAFAEKKLNRELELQQVSELLRDGSRRAGFTPCRAIQHLIRADRRNLDQPVNAITWTEGQLRLAHMSDDLRLVRDILGPTRLRIEGSALIPPHHPILIADCFYAEIINIKHSQNQGADVILTLDQAHHFPYRAPVYVGEWIEERFYTQHKTLYYDANRAEKLTEEVSDLSAELLPSQLLRLALQADKGEPWLLETRLRTI